jgi:predicted nucleic acid-binding protein
VRIALDTNILAHAEGVNGVDMKRTALELVEKLPESAVLLPVQTLGELFNLSVRKAARPSAKARKAILSWRDAFSLIETSAEVLLSAADVATDHQVSIWDAVIVSAAAERRMSSASFRGLARRIRLEGRHSRRSVCAQEA